MCQKEDVHIEFDVNKFARQECSKSQKELNAFINEHWTEKCKNNNRIYNASKFRLASFTCDGNGVNIKVGVTSYKVSEHRYLINY